MRALLRHLIVFVSAAAVVAGAVGDSPPQSRRFLGWMREGDASSGVVLTLSGPNASATLGGSIAAVQLSPAGATSSNNEPKAAGWVLTTDDKMIEGKAASAFIGNAGAENAYLVFAFPNPGQIRAFVCRIGGEVFMLKVPPRTAGLSDDAQFFFDMLVDIPAAAAFESPGGSAAKPSTPAEMETKEEIKNLKGQLSKMGVNVQWDAQQKRYIIPAK